MAGGHRQQDIKNGHLDGEVGFLKSNYTNLDNKVKTLMEERNNNLKKIEDHKTEAEVLKKKMEEIRMETYCAGSVLLL